MTAELTVGGIVVPVLIMLTLVFACDRLPLSADRLTPRLLSRAGMLLTVWGISGGIPPLATVFAGSGSLLAVITLVPPAHLSRLKARLQRSAAQKRHSHAVQQPAAWIARDAYAEPTTHAESRDTLNVVQQQIRRRTATGEESIRGTVVVSFHAGDRLAVAHVGFCPPLLETPAVQLSTAYDERDAVVAAGEVLPWGIRVECRLEEPAEDPFDIPVDYVATPPQPPRLLP